MCLRGLISPEALFFSLLDAAVHNGESGGGGGGTRARTRWTTVGEFEFTQRRGDGLWRSDSATRKQRARPVSGAMHLQKGKCVKPLFRSLLLARALILDDRCCAATLLESSMLSRSEWEKKHSNHHRGILHYTQAPTRMMTATPHHHGRAAHTHTHAQHGCGALALSAPHMWLAVVPKWEACNCEHAC